MARTGIEGLIERWDGIAIVSRYDAETGSWIFIALHDDTLGKALGGSRLKVYPTPADGLIDAMRLARGMTYKWAAIDAAYGGGKAVLALSRQLDDDERRHLLERYASLLNSLGGIFSTGQDLGTTLEDIAFLGTLCPYIHGADGGKAEDPSPYTARGVFLGIKAAVAEVDGTDSFDGLSVLIQGAGNVGSRLAELVSKDGGHVMIADTNDHKAIAIAREVNGEIVDSEAVYTTPCDIYAPCAVGATLNEETIPQLKCRIVAGSANNQLAQPEDAARLHQRGILYTPDYVINAGGAIALGPLREETPAVRNERVAQIGKNLAAIFADASSRDESPAVTVRRRLDEMLAERRSQ